MAYKVSFITKLCVPYNQNAFMLQMKDANVKHVPCSPLDKLQTYTVEAEVHREWHSVVDGELSGVEAVQVPTVLQSAEVDMEMQSEVGGKPSGVEAAQETKVLQYGEDYESSTGESVVISSDIDEASCGSEEIDYQQSIQNLPCFRLPHSIFDQSASPPVASTSTTACQPSSSVKVIRRGVEAAEVDRETHSAVDDEPSVVEAAEVFVPSSSVKVMRTDNAGGKRKYDKVAYCLYCKLPHSHIVRHLETVHRKERQVQELAKMSKASRKTALRKLRNMGNHTHNISVLTEGAGDLVVTYRPNAESDAVSYVPCESCYAYVHKKDLYRHKCPVRGKSKGRVAAAASLLLPAPNNVCAAAKVLIAGMRDDEVKQAAENDAIVSRLASKLLGKHTMERKEYMRAKIRELCRFLIEMRKVCRDESMTVKDCINPSYFRQVIVAVKTLAGYNDNTCTYEKPSIAMKLGHVLKKCAKLCRTEAVMESDNSSAEAADKFFQLCEDEWTDEISSQAQKTLTDRHRNNIDLLPLSEDVSKLHSYLHSEISRCQKLLSEGALQNYEVTWRCLAEVVLVQIICFNRRRAGEVSRMTVNDFHNRTTADLSSDIQQTLSPVEKSLCKMFTRIELRGKRGRMVPILLTSDILQAVNVLVSERARCGIKPGNNYVFAVNHSENCLRGSDCLRNVSTKCGAIYPERLRSTKLRKHVATLSQILNLKKNELDVLAQFMGHDIAVHRQFYRLPSETLQSAHIAKIFLLMEKGAVTTEHGKSLLDVSLDRFVTKRMFYF